MQHLDFLMAGGRHATGIPSAAKGEVGGSPYLDAHWQTTFCDGIRARGQLPVPRVLHAEVADGGGGGVLGGGVGADDGPDERLQGAVLRAVRLLLLHLGRDVQGGGVGGGAGVRVVPTDHTAQRIFIPYSSCQFSLIKGGEVGSWAGGRVGGWVGGWGVRSVPYWVRSVPCRQ